MAKKNKLGSLSNKRKKVKPLSPQLAQMMQQAVTLHQQKQYFAAEKLYRQVLSQRPKFPAANQFMGLLAHQLGHSQLAIQFFKTALSSSPNDLEILNNYGVVLTECKGYPEAISVLRKATKLSPKHGEANYNLAIAYYKNSELQSAINQFEIALKITPKSIDTLINAASACSDFGLVSKALYLYKRAVELAPSRLDIVSNYLGHLNYDANLSAKQLYNFHKELGDHFPKESRIIDSKSPRRKIRVGYVSNDFYSHSVAHFFEPLLTHHDRDTFDVYCYYNNKKYDDKTMALRQSATQWRDIFRLSDEDVLTQVKQDAIDILVDLGGHSVNNRLSVFSKRAAPNQVTWLGYPNTTGIAAMDYRIVDEITDPKGEADNLSSETLIRLPYGFLCYGMEKISSSEEDPPYLKNKYITYGSFNNLAKVNDQVIEAWSKILSAQTNSRLLLKDRKFAQNETKERIIESFAKYGINADRLTLHGYIENNKSHLELYNKIDIALDTFPYNGTTTTAEALSMAIPVITFYGDRHASRVGASILTAIGETHLIANDLDEYIQLAIKLAKKVEELGAIRTKLRENMHLSSFCNAKQFAKQFESVFLAMMQSQKN